MAQPTNPSFDIAHLGHVELFTDRMDESLDFFTRVYGLTLSGRQEVRPICVRGMIMNFTP